METGREDTLSKETCTGDIALELCMECPVMRKKNCWNHQGSFKKLVMSSSHLQNFHVVSLGMDTGLVLFACFLFPRIF